MPLLDAGAINVHSGAKPSLAATCCFAKWRCRNNMKSLARLRTRLSTQLQPSDQSNLADAQAPQEMLTNPSGASARGRVATPLKVSPTCPLQSPHRSYLRISSSAFNTESAAVLSLRVLTRRDHRSSHHLVYRTLPNQPIHAPTFNVPATPHLHL